MEDKNDSTREEIEMVQAIERLLSKRLRILKVGRYVLHIQVASIIAMVFFLVSTGFVRYSLRTGGGLYTLVGWATTGTTPSASTPQPSSSTPLLTGQDVANLEKKLAELEAEIDVIETTGQPDQLDRLESELREIRLTISGDPEKVLALQRMDFEISRLESRLDNLEALTKWIFGVTLTLAFAVLGVVLAAVIKMFFSSGSSAKESDS